MGRDGGYGMGGAILYTKLICQKYSLKLSCDNVVHHFRVKQAQNKMYTTKCT